MAKRECPFCKEKVNAAAIVCKHCKSELPPLPPKKWYQGWKGVLLFIFVLGLVGAFLNPTPPEKEIISQAPQQQAVATTVKNFQCDQKAAFRALNALKEMANISIKKDVVYYSWVDNWHSLTTPQKEAMIEIAANSDACIEGKARKIFFHYQGDKVAEADPVWGIKVLK